MFDLKEIREAPERFDAGWTARGLAPQSEAIVALDQRRRAVLTELQTLQAERNDASKRVGQAKASGDHAAAQALIDRVGEIKARIQTGEEEAQAIEAELDERLSALPNLPRADVPVGADEHANVEVRRWGEPRPSAFPPKQHYEIGEALGLMDFEAAARMSGARFVVLKGELARLERAIGQLMLDTHTTDYGYTEVSPPLLVWDRTMFGTGQLPKFREEQFRAGTDHWLVPTAEVPLTNLVREQILGADELPKRLTALTPCFRAEAGAAGRDTRGMIRLHQFLKVELVSITTSDASEAELERMTACATSILERLELPYRVMALSTGDMGFSARKTYDIEVWLPGQDAYREISSCSDCGDFQARRMGARYRPQADASPRFVHTLNGSGLAVGRTLVAVLENNQQADGTVRVPEALIPYMGGISVIGA